MVNDWDCCFLFVCVGLVAWLLKFWPVHWCLHLCLGCACPLIGCASGVNGWGGLVSMIEVVGAND